MTKQQKLLSIACTLMISGPAGAAITNLGSYTKTADGEETFTDVFGGGTQLFNYTSGDIYVTFDMTFTNPTTGTLDVTQSYGGYSHSSGDLFGQLWEQSSVGVAYYGERTNIAGVTISPGDPITMVVKYELNNVGLDSDTIKFWVNPALGTGTEVAPDDADPTRTWGPTNISSDQMRFRRGNGSENQILFSDVTIYDNGDTPFAAVPEPSSTILLSLAGLGLVARRRR